MSITRPCASVRSLAFRRRSRGLTKPSSYGPALTGPDPAGLALGLIRRYGSEGEDEGNARRVRARQQSESVDGEIVVSTTTKNGFPPPKKKKKSPTNTTPKRFAPKKACAVSRNYRTIEAIVLNPSPSQQGQVANRSWPCAYRGKFHAVSPPPPCLVSENKKPSTK